MSTDLAKFESLFPAGSGPGNAGKPMHVTAFYGGMKYGAAVQFSVGYEYTALSERQVKRLIQILQTRLDGKVPQIDSDEVVTP